MGPSSPLSLENHQAEGGGTRHTLASLRPPGLMGAGRESSVSAISHTDQLACRLPSVSGLPTQSHLQNSSAPSLGFPPQVSRCANSLPFPLDFQSLNCNDKKRGNKIRGITRKKKKRKRLVTNVSLAPLLKHGQNSTFCRKANLSTDSGLAEREYILPFQHALVEETAPQTPKPPVRGQMPRTQEGR